MKKFISLTLAVLMVMAMIPTALAAELDDICDLCLVLPADVCSTCGGEYCYECFEYHDCVPATNPHTQGTKVEYTATGSEAYTITVPAQLAPSGSGTVTLSGTWASDRKVTVTADKTVTLVNSINAADTKTLDVTFAGISKAGDNTQAKTYTEAVSVAAMPADALFGTWSGTFYYNVELLDILTLVTSPYKGVCVLCSDSGDECVCNTDASDMETEPSLLDVVNAAKNMGASSINVQTVRNFLILNDDYFDGDDYADMISLCQEIHDLYTADYVYTYFQKSASEIGYSREQLWNKILADAHREAIFSDIYEFAHDHGIIITEDVDANGYPVYYFSIYGDT